MNDISHLVSNVYHFLYFNTFAAIGDRLRRSNYPAIHNAADVSVGFMRARFGKNIVYVT